MIIALNRKKKSWVCTIIAFILLVTIGAQLPAQSTKPITQKGLVSALSLGGLQTAELIRLIQRRGVDFVSTPEIEQELQGVGATEDVLQAVRQNYRGAPVPPKKATSPAYTAPPYTPPPPPPPAQPMVPRAPGVYLKEGSTYVPLLKESAAWRKEGLMKSLKAATNGLVNGEATGEVAGTHSSTSAHSPATFLIRASMGMGPQDYIVVHLHGKHDNREFKIAMDGLRSKDQVECSTTRLSNDLIQVAFEQGAGDYAIISRHEAPTPDNYGRGGFLYTFQVTQ